MLPTVTEVCRTSLLTGDRKRGEQTEEREGFAANRALQAVSAPGRPPVLFHKASLTTPGGLALPHDVRQAVADPAQRVVGVVVNAVDDHLTRGDQIRVRWDLESVRPLGRVLDAAEEAGRLVVLTADHGHVLREPGAHRRSGSTPGGERWRIPPPPPGEDEVAVRGPRVLLGGGSVVLPVEDQISYGVPKHGYHGGATPAEVLVPVEVLARHPPSGWVHRPLTSPTWWGDTTGASPLPAPAAGTARPRRRWQPDQDALFEPAGPVPGSRSEPRTGWVDRLLASPAFQGQRARLPRPMPDERLRQYLSALDAHGGAMLLTALAARTGEPADALRMALAFVQRLLNLDGAQVLAIRADGMVQLDRALLGLQFEIAV